jgi:hypothetical protein
MDLETTFEDYTDMVEGARTSDGAVIARCPRCQRMGRFMERPAGVETYDHRQIGPDETRETCVIPKPRI